MNQQNARLSASLYAAFQRGDLQYILDHVSDDVTWGFHDIPGSGVPMYGLRSGKKGVASFFQDLMANLDFHKFEPWRITAEGDEVMVLLSIGTTVKKTGIRVDQDEEVHVFKIIDGKVRIARFYHDAGKTIAAFQAKVPAAAR